MKRVFLSIALIALLVFSSTFAVGFLDIQPASKATAKYADYTILDWQETDTSKTVPWQTILDTTIKTSSQKDLFVDASLESGLWTYTQVKSKDMTTDTANAMANIMVRVLIDGNEAYPGEVTFAKRSQTLSATLQGELALVDKNKDGIVQPDELVTVAPEEISLLLDTMSANSFNFILDNVGTGTHKVEVQAKIDLGASAQAGDAEAKALIGKGSVTVEEVRMINDAELTLN